MAVTPGGRIGDATPLGKPGGKRRLSDYTREIAHALMRQGHPKSEAIAIARAAEKKFAVKSKNPTIRSAALKATAEDRLLSHQKRDKSMSNEQQDIDGSSWAPFVEQQDIDASWAAFDANRPPGAGQPAAAPAPAPAAAPAPDFLSPEVHQNIAHFQAAHGLPVTGNIDPATTAWLNDPKNSKTAQAAAKAASSTASSAAKKTAAAQTAAQKKAAAAKKKADNATTAAAKKKATADAAQAKTNQKNALTAGKAAVKAGSGGPVAVRTANMSVPIVGINDGARVTMAASNFGGKKAAPFGKGGSRKKVDAAKIEMARRIAAQRAAQGAK